MYDFDEMWDYQHPDATEQKFRLKLEQVRSSEEVGYLAALLTQIARAQGLQGKFIDAHETLDQVEAQLPKSDDTARIRYLLERGRVYNSSSQQEEAIPLFLKAWEIGVQAKEDYYAVDAAHMLGISESTPETRLAWNMKALSHAEQSPKAGKWLGSLYNNIGWAKVETGALDEALDLFERALEFRKSQGEPGALFIARWCVAKVLRLLKRVEESLVIQQALLAETELTSTPDGYVYEEMAECLLMLHRKEEARRYFARSYECLRHDNWLIAHEPERIARIQQYANGV
ncbi:hypothetical protein [Paenibacillus sp. ACRRX]|uniref:tetratricopeptide repeat protein n=1 Tax=Paenibacillus sp. ACRRX TaxID=2918206 RepID=UPI001EF44AF6|nr:hypothetical protein [Paenibacillus sp. ACRRX]